MKNFELHDKAVCLSDSETSYELARKLISVQEENEVLKEKLAEATQSKRTGMTYSESTAAANTGS